MEERFHVPLVLCCAEENEVALVRVVDELHKEGRAPEVVAGVDVDGNLLSNAVDRTDGPALFVLCQTDELDRVATRRLAGLFSARKAPEHRIVTVQLTPQRPMSILPPIRSALKEVVRARYEAEAIEPPEPVGDDRVHMRDVVGPTGVSAVGPQEQDPESLAKRLHKEMLAAEALLERRKSEPRGRRPTPGRPRAPSKGEPGAPQSVMDDEEARPRSLMPDLDRLPSAALETNPDVVETELTPTEHRVKRRGLADDPRPEPAAGEVEERPGNRVLLFVAIAGITALALMAVLQMSGGNNDDPAPRGDAVPAAQHETKSRPGPTKTETKTPSEVPKPPEDKEGKAEEVDTPPAPPPPPSDTAALVVDLAIADGKIRSLDNLLVLKPGREAMTWGEANRLCYSRVVADIRGWHLPSSAEMKRLRRSRMLGAATYWTRQRNAAKDEALALDNRTGRLNQYLTVERVGRPMCVRKR